MNVIHHAYDPIAAAKQRTADHDARHQRLMAAIDRLKGSSAKPIAPGHVSRYECGDRTYWRRRENAMLRDRLEARRCRVR